MSDSNETLLAIDTSTSAGSCALYINGEFLDENSWPKEGSTGKVKHSDVLTEEVSSLLTKNNVSLNSVTKLALSLGPGSFTGLRVACNFTRTLAYTNNLSVFVTDTLTLLAQSRPQEKPPLVVGLNAFQNKIYTREFVPGQNGAWEPSGPVSLLGLSDFCELFQTAKAYAGDASDYYQEVETNSLFSKNATLVGNLKPQARTLGNIALNYPHLGQELHWTKVLPLYVKSSEAEEKIKTGELKPVDKIF